MISRLECKIPFENVEIPLTFEKYDSADGKHETADFFLYLGDKNILVNQVSEGKNLLYIDLNLNGVRDIFPLELDNPHALRNEYVHSPDELLYSEMCTEYLSL